MLHSGLDSSTGCGMRRFEYRAVLTIILLWLFEYTTPCLRSTDLMQLAQLRMARFVEDSVTVTGGNQVARRLSFNGRSH
jgi:hypothetical protein